MSGSQSSQMRGGMNPLDFLAEVAASCTDDDTIEKLQHSDECVEAKAECSPEVDICMPVDAVPSTPHNHLLSEVDSTSQGNKLAPPSTVKDCTSPIGEHVIPTRDQNDNIHDHSSGSSSQENIPITAENCSNAESATDSHANSISPLNGVLAASDVDNGATPRNDAGGSVSKTPVILAPSDSSSPPDMSSTGDNTSGSSVATVTNGNTLPRNAHEHGCLAKTSPSPELPSQQASSLASIVTRSQPVIRHLSPNFKLTMTDSIPVVQRNRNVSSLLIGNYMGSAKLTHAVVSAMPTQVVTHRPVLVRQRSATVARKYPNISMSTIPSGYPLLDHDYCYHVYCDIVQAAVKAVKEQNAAKKSLAKASESLLNEDGRPVKRKYRTKKIIAEELEAKRLAVLRQKAADGDVLAKEELSSIEQQQQKEREMKSKKKSTKRSLGVSTPEVDSEEEVWNEMTEDMDRDDPVIDHDPSFKDQFFYFGSKKYKSRSRHLNKKADPYESFWKTGQLKSDRPRSTDGGYSSLSMGDRLPGDLTINTKQHMNDVFDVLGISPCESQSTEYEGAEPSDTVPRPSSATSDYPGANSCTTPSSTAQGQSPLVDRSNCSLINNAPSSDSLKKGGGSDLRSDSGFDDLMQGLSMDQVSELLLALDVEPSLSQGSGHAGEFITVDPDAVAELDVQKQEAGKEDMDHAHVIPSLYTLARGTCQANSIPLTSAHSSSSTEQCSSIDNDREVQLSQTSNISLDITEADLQLVPDKNFNLDILNDLSATPPKASPYRPSSSLLPRTPSTQSSRVIAPRSARSCDSPSSTTEEPIAQSPMVVPVTMYWNTFPALLLDGVKYVRLIDISRQALPSKETGLLKKRAQNLGYEVTTCTDLQRNLLVRYAFACPSRSNLMVSEAGAAEVIASYMEKSEMEELSKAPDLPSLQLPANVKSTTTTTVRAPAEPVTLMPQVLIQHQPLQQSSSAGGRRSAPTKVDLVAAPERSSRLRQIKSSYRRFLGRGASTAISTANGTTAENNNYAATVTEENGSDRGYHSDQSPDSLVDKPIHIAKSKKHKEAKNPRSARRSLSTSQAGSTIPAENCEGGKRAVSDDTASSMQTVPAALASPAAANELHCDDMAIPLSPTPLETPVSPASLGLPLSPDPSVVLSSTSADVQSFDIDSDSVHKSQLENSVSQPMFDISAKSEIIHIRHIDLVVSNSRARCTQDGELFLQFFKSLHSPCIQCSSCRQFYTLQAFTKHQHHNQELVPVKIRQRIEARADSVDSDAWHTFKKRKQIFETKRSPLKRLSETRLSKPSSPSPHVHIDNSPISLSPLHPPPPAINSGTRGLGKRIPKQKKCNPDEVYYITNPCITNTSRKRKAEAALNSGKRSKCSVQLSGLKKRIER